MGPPWTAEVNGSRWKVLVDQCAVCLWRACGVDVSPAGAQTHSFIERLQQVARRLLAVTSRARMGDKEDSVVHWAGMKDGREQERARRRDQCVCKCWARAGRALSRGEDMRRRVLEGRHQATLGMGSP
jgi:hypothetical protein